MSFYLSEDSLSVPGLGSPLHSNPPREHLSQKASEITYWQDCSRKGEHEGNVDTNLSTNIYYYYFYEYIYSGVQTASTENKRFFPFCEFIKNDLV